MSIYTTFIFLPVRIYSPLCGTQILQFTIPILISNAELLKASNLQPEKWISPDIKGSKDRDLSLDQRLVKTKSAFFLATFGYFWSLKSTNSKRREIFSRHPSRVKNPETSSGRPH